MSEVKTKLGPGVLKSLECGVCLKTMEDPVTLHCQHSFCRKCIGTLAAHTFVKGSKAYEKNLYEGISVKCPVCPHRTLIEDWLPNDSINLQPDPQVRASLDIWHDEQYEMQCCEWGDCVVPGAPPAPVSPLFICNDNLCRGFRFCESCFNSRHDRAHLDHRIHKLLYNLPKELQLRKSKCPHHPELDRAWLCSTCNDVLCIMCARESTGHLKHQTTKLSLQIEALRDENQVGKMKEKISEEEGRLSSVNAEWNNIQKLLNKRLDSIRNVLSTLKVNSSIRGESLSNSKLEMLQSSGSIIRFRQKSMAYISSFLQKFESRLHKHPRGVELAFMKNVLIPVINKNIPSGKALNTSSLTFLSNPGKINALSDCVKNLTRVNLVSQGPITCATYATGFSIPYQIAVDGKTIYVSDAGDHCIKIISSDDPLAPAKLVAIGSPQGQLYHPFGLSLESKTRTLFVTEYKSHKINAIHNVSNRASELETAASSTMVTIAGNDTPKHIDGEARSAFFHYPTGIVVAKNGTIFVADMNNNCIRQIRREPNSTTVTTIAGHPNRQGHTNGKGDIASFSFPCGLCIDSNNHLLVGQQGFIRRLSLFPDNKWQVTCVGASPEVEYFGSLVPSVVVDDLGQIFVADHDNNRICVGDSQGPWKPLISVVSPFCVTPFQSNLLVSSGNEIKKVDLRRKTLSADSHSGNKNLLYALTLWEKEIRSLARSAPMMRSRSAAILNSANADTLNIQPLTVDSNNSSVILSSPASCDTAITLGRFSNNVMAMHQLAFCVLCAVDHLNSRGWFHCDIKSDNVLLMERPHIEELIWVLRDVGTSQNGNPLLVAPGHTFPGNVQNRSPEVIQAHITGKFPLLKNDVWAVGCVLYELISGGHPFLQGDELTMHKICDTTLPPLIPDCSSLSDTNQCRRGRVRGEGVGEAPQAPRRSPPRPPEPPPPEEPSPSFPNNATAAGLVGWLLEREASRRPTAREALLACGALLSLPPPLIAQFLRASQCNAAASAAPQPQLRSSQSTPLQPMRQGPQQNTPQQQAPPTEDLKAAMRLALYTVRENTVTAILQHNAVPPQSEQPSRSLPHALTATLSEVIKVVYCCMGLRDVASASRALLAFLDAASSPRYNLNLQLS
ncbi:hypothetical protein Pelo_3218 [Pelomyxa schiedti]|nr:hypothetical protein Pelo_3218 [Pelomyxa schiedti]